MIKKRQTIMFLFLRERSHHPMCKSILHISIAYNNSDHIVALLMFYPSLPEAFNLMHNVKKQ